MYKQVTISAKKWVKMTIALSFMMISGIFSKATAQCKYLAVTTEGVINVTHVPSDFPVFNFANSDLNSLNAFKQVVEKWKLTNPGFENVSFTPTNTQNHFEIPQSDFDLYTADKKEIILSMPFFYTVISNK